MKVLAFVLIISSFAVCAEAGLVAWYKFEVDANDSVGSNHGTMMNGAQIITNLQRGQVLSLDGENDYVFLSIPVITTREFTIAAWANHLDMAGGIERTNQIFNQRDDLTGDNRSCVTLVTEYPKMVPSSAATTIRSSSGTAQTLSFPKKEYGQWHHYACTLSLDYFIFYIDGMEVDRVENLQEGVYNISIDYVDIGRRRFNGITRSFFNGLIDDIRFYDNALSPEEVNQLYLDGMPIPVSVDIKPSDCPNPLNVKSRGVLPVAMLGSEDFDVNSIDLTSIRLAGVAPVRSRFEDVATPVSDLNDCACNTEGPDGFTDLVLKFRTPEIVAALVDSCGTISKGDVISLTLTATLSSDQPIVGSDCVVIVGKVPRELTAMRSDVNKDGIINYLDFAWIAEYWPEPAFVE